MQLTWQLPNIKQLPISFTLGNQIENHSQTFLNPFLGYPNCPIIGRYNKGQYKIGQTIIQIQFICQFNKQTSKYQCKHKTISLPQQIVYNLQNIPQIIQINKIGTPKNAPDYIIQKFIPRNSLSFRWIVSFGELGKDFLNYLNHMYILANTLFLEEKLQKTIHYLPIYATLPKNSGLQEKQIERGLSLQNFRGKGSPAFSPNNMRLGVEGGKIITSKNNKKQCKQKQKNIKKQKQQKCQKYEDEPKLQKKIQIEQQINISQLQNQINNQNNIIQKVQNVKQLKKQSKHQGFIHFYTSVLLQQQYRVHYHWHIDDKQKQQILKIIFVQSKSIQQFCERYKQFIGCDSLVSELQSILFKYN